MTEDVDENLADDIIAIITPAANNDEQVFRWLLRLLFIAMALTAVACTLPF